VASQMRQKVWCVIVTVIAPTIQRPPDASP
jgi:hypothetical protein